MARSKVCLAVLALGLSGCPLFDIPKDDFGSGLEWQDPPATESMTSDDATRYCEGLEQGGHDDWRVPSLDELRTLVEGCPETMPEGACLAGEECLDVSCGGDESSGDTSCSCPDATPPEGGCFHVSGFSERCDCYKSSSAVTGNAAGATYHWELCFSDGHVAMSPASTLNSVRCVRGSVSNGDVGGPPSDSTKGPGSSNGPGTGSGPGIGGNGAGGGGTSFPATRNTYTGTPATMRFAATIPPHSSTAPSYPMNGMTSVTTRGVLGGAAITDSGGSCGDGSAFICSPGGCCGADVTSTPSACCSAGCCADTVYCDALTGGCGYSCEPGEVDCGDGACCPSGTSCGGGGTCVSDVAACPDATLDCGNGTCCPSGTMCGAGTCDSPSMCDPGSNDCGDGSCCPNGSSCVGGSQCEQPGCDEGVQCGDFCCNAGDQCLGNGACAPFGCEGDELDCGGGFCCPSGTQCDGQSCMELPMEPRPMEQPPMEQPPPDASQPPIGSEPSGSCSTEDLLMALGGASSGNACVDGCVQSALRCAGAAGCVLTSACQNAEASCVMSCFPSGG